MSSMVSASKCASQKKAVISTPCNSPREDRELKRPLTKKEKKGLKRREYRKRKQMKNKSDRLNKFAEAIHQVSMNHEAVSKIAGPREKKAPSKKASSSKNEPEKANECSTPSSQKVIVEEITDENVPMDKEEEIVGAVEVNTEKEENEENECAETTSIEKDMANIIGSQSRIPRRASSKKEERMREKAIKRHARLQKKAIDNYNRNIQIIQNFKRDYPALAKAFIVHIMAKSEKNIKLD